MRFPIFKPPANFDNQTFIVRRRYNDYAHDRQYELVDVDLYQKIIQGGWTAKSSGAHHYNNSFYGAILNDMGIGCSIWVESDRPLEIDGIYQGKFDKNPLNSGTQPPKFKVTKKIEIKQKTA